MMADFQYFKASIVMSLVRPAKGLNRNKVEGVYQSLPIEVWDTVVWFGDGGAGQNQCRFGRIERGCLWCSTMITPR